ncbi:6119_t:CDS:2 [Funneliformis geosporum]|nr:6119_t:CDS:2 [Funneliformis geosporum]
MSTSITTESSVEEVEGYNMETLITYLQNQLVLNLSEQHINVLRENEVTGYDFLRCEKKEEDLKRHFDEIAERLDHKIDGVSHEMKKVQLHSEVMWYSTPGTNTETDKDIFVGSRDTEIKKKLQEYFINECKPLQISKNLKLVVEDVHFFPLLATRKPDFVFITKDNPLDALCVVAILQLQPHDNIRFSYEYALLANLNYESSTYPPARWKYLVMIMECDSEKLGWIEPSLKFNSYNVKLIRSINTGRTSNVYEGKLNDKDSVVVKLAKEEKYSPCFEREKDALINFNSLHIPSLLLYDKNSLITTPLGTKVKNLQKRDVRNIIETLRMVHSKNIMHMDLQRYNFICDHDEKIIIIDWGYSAMKNETGNFAGAFECMPDDILQSLVNSEQILYSPSINLICLVRSFYLLLHKLANVAMERISFDEIPDFKSRAKNVLTF